MYFKIIILFFIFTLKVYSAEKILNVSYDPTRSLYEEINVLFEKYYKQTYNKNIKILQSHGGSGKQARSVIEGIPANVVSLATEYDIEEIVKRGFIKQHWKNKFPNHSAPFTSTIVFIVRKNNPKSIYDWNDLIRDDIKVIMPNPKTSGVAKLEYLALWSYAIEKYQTNELAYDFMKKLFNNIPVLDSSSRGAAISFTNRHLGDVLVTWENEAYLTIKELEADQLEIIFPSVSIEALLPVAIVNYKNLARKDLNHISKEYINFLYSQEAQEIAAKNYFRPVNEEILLKYQDKFKKIKTFSLDKIGDLKTFYSEHFGKNGILEKIFEDNKI